MRQHNDDYRPAVNEQVVWAASTSVGCGVRRCSNLAGVSNGANWYIVVCNYGPA